jgi:hypothetical protein
MSDGMAMDSQPRGHSLAALGWPTRQPIAHVESRCLATMMVPLSLLLEGLDSCRNDGDRFAHRLLSSQTN